MAEIENLSIQISANAGKAAAGIDKLASSLEKLKTAVSGTNMNNLKTIATSLNDVVKNIGETPAKIQELAAAVGALSHAAGSVKNLEKLADGLNALGNATKNVGANIGQKLTALGNGLSALSGVSGVTISDSIGRNITEINTALTGVNPANFAKIETVANALGKLSAVGAVKIPASVSNQIVELGIAAQQIENIDFTSFERMANSLATLGQAKDIKLSSTIASGIAAIAQSVQSLTGVDFSLIEALGRALGAFGGASSIRIPKSVAEEIINISIAANTITDEMVQHLNDIAAALQRLGSVGTIRIPRIPTQPGNGGGQGGNSPTDGGMSNVPPADSPAGSKFDFSKYIHAAANAFAGLGKAAATAGPAVGGVVNSLARISGLSGIVGTVFGDFGKQLSSIGSAARQNGLAALPIYFGKQLVSSVVGATKSVTGFLAQIKRVAMYRIIRSAIKMITQGFAEGTKNLYHWSQQADQTFSKAMDRMATSSQYLKNSLGAMASPLLESFAPVLDYVADQFVELFNMINQFMSRLMGRTTYTAAKKVAAEWDDASKKTNKAAKDIKRTILSFDEINKLNGNTGSGSSASQAQKDYASMFETRTIEGAVSTFADQVKAAFEAGDWKGLGKTLGGKVNEIVENLENGGFFKSAGEKVGKGINGWFTTKYWTLDTINFTNIGTNIATFLNNAFNQIDFATVAATLVQKMGIIGDTIIGFLTTFDWEKFAGDLSAFVNGLYGEITKWLGKYDWANLGTILGGKIVDFIVGIDYSGIATAFYNALDAALTAGLNLLGGIIDGITKKFQEKIKWNTLSENVQRQIANIAFYVGLGTTAIGAILAFSGISVGPGIAMMIAGGVSAGVGASLKWGSIGDLITSHMKEIKNALVAGALVLGAILTFSGTNIPLGLGMMIAGAYDMWTERNGRWGDLFKTVKGWINEYGRAIGAGLFGIGAVLALTGVATGLGIGMMLSGAALFGITISPAKWGEVYKTFKNWISQYGSAVGIGLFSIGALLALTGVATGLGIGMMLAGAATFGLSIKSEQWGNVYKTFKGWIEQYGKAVGIGLFALGALLSLTGVATGLGIAMMIGGAAAFGLSVKREQWGDVYRTFKGWITQYGSAVGLGLFALGALLTLTGVATGIGIAMVIAGAATFGLTTKNTQWGDMYKTFKGWITQYGTAVSLGMFALGALLMLTGVGTGLGIAMMLGGMATFGLTPKSERWNDAYRTVKNWISNYGALVGLGMFALGGFLLLTGIGTALGIGMMIAGTTLTIGSTAWSGTYNTFKEWVKQYGVFIGTMLFALGALLALTGVGTALGIGMMIAGATVAIKAAQWSGVFQTFKEWFKQYKAIIMGALIVMGALMLLAGQVPIGLGLILAGSAGLAEEISANWGNLVQLGKDIVGKVKEGWDTAKDFVLNIVPQTANKWLAGVLGVDTTEGQVKAITTGIKIAQALGLVPKGNVEAEIDGVPGTSMKYGTGAGRNGGSGRSAIVPIVNDTTVEASVNASAGQGVGRNKSGTGLAPIVSDTTVDVAVNGKAGKGMTDEEFWKGWTPIVSDASVDVTVNGKPGSGMVQQGDGLGIKLPTLSSLMVQAVLENNVSDLLGSLKKWWDIQKGYWYFKLLTAPELEGNSGTNLLSTMKTLWDNSKNWWNYILQPTVQADGGTGGKLLNETKNQWDGQKDWWNNVLYPTIEANGGTGATLLKTVKDEWDKGRDYWWNVLKAKVEVQNDSGSWWSNVVTWWNNVKGKLSIGLGLSGGMFAEGGYISGGKIGRFADGGVIHAYAGGTSRVHGSLFLAGEAGPEILGHVGGKTEVLNKSQLAATMFSAVRSAMSGVTLDANFYDSGNGMTEEEAEALLELVRQGSEATMRQNELLRQQNELLRQLNDKEFSAEITTSSINRAQARANRRAGMTVAPVGT